MAETLEGLQVWQRAKEFWNAINAIVEREALRTDKGLRDQLKRCSDSILANMSEGFAQPTDRAFSNYLFTSKASTAEARTHLASARDRGYITDADFTEANAIGDEVAAMTTGLIKYLRRSDRRDRGLGLSHGHRRHDKWRRPDRDRR